MKTCIKNSIIYDKSLAILKSCVTMEQLTAATRYLVLASKYLNEEQKNYLLIIFYAKQTEIHGEIIK